MGPWKVKQIMDPMESKGSRNTGCWEQNHGNTGPWNHKTRLRKDRTLETKGPVNIQLWKQSKEPKNIVPRKTLDPGKTKLWKLKLLGT